MPKALWQLLLLPIRGGTQCETYSERNDISNPVELCDKGEGSHCSRKNLLLRESSSNGEINIVEIVSIEREFLFFFLRVKKLRIYKYWRGSRVEEENNYRDILCNRTIFKKLDIVKKKKDKAKLYAHEWKYWFSY